MSKEQADKKKAPPMKHLLETSDFGVGIFELAKLGEAADLRSMMLTTLANLRREMLAAFDGIIERTKKEISNQEAVFDRLVDETAQAALAAMLRRIDRQDLVRQLLESSTVTIDGILADAKAQIRNSGRSAEESEAAQMPMRIFPPGVAHRNAAKRYMAANIAEGKCQNCPEPLDRDSVRYCTKHLAAARTKSARQRGVKGEPGSADYLYGEITESTHGRQPGTLQSLALSREKKTRAVLAELGIKPEDAAVTLRAAKEALLRVMPDSKAKALPAYDLFQAAQIPTGAGQRSTTGYKALRELLALGKIERMGKAHPLLYFKLEKGEHE